MILAAKKKATKAMMPKFFGVQSAAAAATLSRNELCCRHCRRCHRCCCCRCCSAYYVVACAVVRSLWRAVVPPFFWPCDVAVAAAVAVAVDVVVVSLAQKPCRACYVIRQSADPLAPYLTTPLPQRLRQLFLSRLRTLTSTLTALLPALAIHFVICCSRVVRLLLFIIFLVVAVFIILFFWFLFFNFQFLVLPKSSSKRKQKQKLKKAYANCNTRWSKSGRCSAADTAIFPSNLAFIAGKKFEYRGKWEFII